MSVFDIVSSGRPAIKWIEYEVSPVLARVLMLPPGNDRHPDVVWIFNWLAETERISEEFLYVVIDLRQALQRTIDLWVYKNNQVSMEILDEYVMPLPTDRYQSFPIVRRHLAKLLNKNGKQGHFYVIKAAAEALAARNSVLVGTSMRAGSLTYLQLKGSRFVPLDMLSNWIIQVVGDPTLCPDIHMRFRMLQLYTKRMVKIDDSNRKQALVSLLTACASLADQHNGWSISVSDIIGCLRLFEEDDFGNAYLFDCDQEIAKKVRFHRKVLLYDSFHKYSYSMGNKVNIPPSELNGIIAIIRYMSANAKQSYQDFQEEYNAAILRLVNNSLSGLVLLYRNFTHVLLDPLVFHVMIDAIIVVMEATVMIMWEVTQEENYNPSKSCLYYFDELLDNLCERPEDVDYYYTDETFIGQEIMKRYKSTFSKIRAHVDKDFISSITFLHNFLHEEAGKSQLE